MLRQTEEISIRRRRISIPVWIALSLLLASRDTFGQIPVLETIFPAGAQAGQSVDVLTGGTNLDGVRTLICNAVGMHCERLDTNRFKLAIPADSVPGQYDLWAVSEHGVSAPRTFVVGQRPEQLEAEPNDTEKTAIPVPLDTVINGRIEKAGDVDCFRFDAKGGQRVIVECSAERIDSRLRAVLELFDVAGRRLAVNRGYFGIDPLIDFHVPADGGYIVKIHDLMQSGSAEFIYRLEIDTKPRVAFAFPSVVQRNTPTRIALYGWNLTDPGGHRAASLNGVGFDRVEVEVSPQESRVLPVRLNPAQAVLDGYAYHFPSSQAALMIGTTDVPVVLPQVDNHSPKTAQEISAPCEVSGQLIEGEETDWYAVQAHRGDVYHIEVLGQRLQSPVCVRMSLFDSSGQQELVQFRDEPQNKIPTFPTSHTDPAGRWVAPADGRYLISVRNLIGGLQSDPRRIYRLSVRREEPDFQVVAVPRRSDPVGLNVRRGGREVIDLVAFRQRGMHGAIRVIARDLPLGIECPDVWIGPDVDRATLVVSANRNAEAVVGQLKLEAESSDLGFRPVRYGALVRSGTPTGWGRLVSQLPIAVAGDSPLRITANHQETLNHHLYGNLKVRNSPGGFLDVAVQIERREIIHQAPVKLIGVGLPESITNQTAVVPAGEQKGYLSFWLPPTLPLGRYSFVIRGETTVPTADGKTESTVVFSDPVNFEVQPAAFVVEVEPFAVTRAKRGEVIQIGYSAQRRNGFIGKMHTELATPGRITNIIGLRGRGETFVGQTDKGSLQIVVNEDAPLGRQEFLRLFTVGVVEDEPVYQGGSFLTLEIVE